MKKMIALLLAAVMCFSLIACGEKAAAPTEPAATETIPEGISADDVAGTWTMDLPYKQAGKGVPAYQMKLHKGGTGEGYEKKDGQIDTSKFYSLKWEIKDDVIVISYEMDPISWSFELDASKTKIIELSSENSFTKE